MSKLVPAAPAVNASGISTALQPFVDRGLLAGAVTLVANANRVVSLEAVGFADLSSRKPMVPDQVFWIASMTKPMTATALMMLVDEGKVNVNDPVEKYLPEFKAQMVIAEKDDEHILLKKPRHPILVREILSHTSGLPFVSGMERPTLDRFALEDAVRSYSLAPLLFEPGSRYEYSNAGTNTAGRIVEVVSGQPYQDFMQERLFAPLGMIDTTFWPDAKQIRRLAKIYKANEQKTGLEEAQLTQTRNPLSDRVRKPVPAGGLFSTASDVAKFCQMILRGGLYQGRRYLSVAAVRKMTTKQTGPEVDQSYGFGWNTSGGTYGHGGAYKTNMTVHPKPGLITVFLVHQASEWPGPGGEAIYPAFLAATLASKKKKTISKTKITKQVHP